MASGTASAAEDDSQPTARQSSQNASNLRGMEGVAVAHWGYDGNGKGWQSEPLDASAKSNSDHSNFAPTTGSAAGASAMGFSCTLWVGNTIRSGGLLEAGTAQTCEGAFLEQWTAAQFERSSWTGYRDYSSVSVSDPTYSETNDITWTVGCGSGGTYNYRLAAIPWATSSEDGKDVSGPLLVGKSGRYSCGT